jgi:hypothetical protein
MLYVCVPTRDHSATIGPLLWKVRRVFAQFPREYQLLVADDGSSDATREVLDLYERALPVIVLRQDASLGYGPTLERLLREATRRTDRPKRDAAITIPPDFTVSPEALPDMIRRLESGADLVVGELDAVGTPLFQWLVRRTAPWLLRPGLSVPGIRDLLSGFYAIRLATLKRAVTDAGRMLQTDGWCANAELVARAAAEARQIAVIRVSPGRAPRRLAHPSPARLALSMLRTGHRLRIPAPTAAVERTT